MRAAQSFDLACVSDGGRVRVLEGEAVLARDLGHQGGGDSQAAGDFVTTGAGAHVASYSSLLLGADGIGLRRRQVSMVLGSTGVPSDQRSA